MTSRLQSLLLRTYGRLSGSALLRSTAGRWVYDSSYALYKRFVEVGDVRVLATLIPRGTNVIDVGANIGFFTLRFARWVSEGGKVIAIEPEPENFARLVRQVRRRGVQDAVIAVEGAAAERTGGLRLAVNPSHPGDHKLAPEGIEVAALRIVDLVARYGGGNPISLIKIDVQGAEERVLEGAWEVIERDHPAVLMEIDDRGLRNYGASAAAVLELMGKRGYRAHRLRRGRIVPAASAALLPACRDGQYVDVLFLADAGVPGLAS